MTNNDVPKVISLLWLDNQTPESIGSGKDDLVYTPVKGGVLVIGSDDRLRAMAGEGASPARYRLRSIDTRGDAPDFSRMSYLLVVLNDIDEGAREESRRWLDEEHSGAQLGIAGTNWYLGYEGIDQPGHFLNLWDIDDPSVIASEEWAKARDTPWREKLAPKTRLVKRDVCRPVQ